VTSSTPAPGAHDTDTTDEGARHRSDGDQPSGAHTVGSETARTPVADSASGGASADLSKAAEEAERALAEAAKAAEQAVAAAHDDGHTAVVKGYEEARRATDQAYEKSASRTDRP
jgi:hypothetical protein